jgi:hypothetical protein
MLAIVGKMGENALIDPVFIHWKNIFIGAL